MKHLSLLGALLFTITPALALTPEQEYDKRMSNSWWPKPGTSFRCYMELEENGLFLFKEVLKV